MTEYWKSNERKYCDFCKCWLSDNKASIAFHESGKRHKLNVAKRITDISRSSEKAERENQKMNMEIRKMEEAAMKSYAQDIHGHHGDMTARSIHTVLGANAAASSSGSSKLSYGKPRQVDPMRLEGDSDEEEDSRRVNVDKVGSEAVPDASLWVEGKSDEGHTYYWNVKTNESVWEPPKEGFLSYEEYERINQLAINQQEITQAEESLRFRANVDEEVARFNRERHAQLYRKPESSKEKKQKEEKRLEFKTEEEAATKEIGQWQVVETKPAAAPIDWELPQTDYYDAAPVVSALPDSEPPVKRFKEKTITTLDAGASSSSGSSTFKKRKFANKGNTRKPLDD
ncbi:WW domain-binding protein 4 [Drosophila sulfurigaster albostrigata]|uniref:WW domain-binding protein 4 n=1 Tax=Drosophila sulfurigaster albostrigata TaxID=89887 RepID=UPI002D21E7AD|nr:WW domain-binding protein 4 [Drosophila sulfurigaster albostrigata]